MTLHKAKGLEFDIVYHLNLNEWELPKKKIEDNDFDHPIYPTWNQDLDLHYVGVTILGYLPWDNPLTLEAIVYGVASAVMLSSVVFWFSSFNTVCR